MNALTQLKEETKRNIEEVLNKNNLAENKAEKEQAVVKVGKSLTKKSVNNIEPQLTVRDPKRNNYRRYKSAN